MELFSFVEREIKNYFKGVISDFSVVFPHRWRIHNNSTNSSSNNNNDNIHIYSSLYIIAI